MVPLYKNNDDIQNCNNYKGVKLLIHTMKVQERGDEGDQKDVHFQESIWIHDRMIDHGSHPSCAETGKKYRERKRDLHMVFIDIEKVNFKVDDNPLEVLGGQGPDGLY